MKLTGKQDIEAPLARVWEVVTDFEAWERAAMRRGADVSRTDKLRAPGPGISWHARALYRGKERKVDLVLKGLEAPHQIDFAASSAAVQAVARIELIDMAARKTRMHVTVEFTPKSLGARLFLQSLRLARGRVERRFADRLALFAREIETRAKA